MYRSIENWLLVPEFLLPVLLRTSALFGTKLLTALASSDEATGWSVVTYQKRGGITQT